MKAIAVRTPADADRALAYADAAALILFDAKPPEGMTGVLLVGNGVAFDWRALLGVKDKAEACRQLMAHAGVTAAQTACIGDDSIDLPAFEACGMSYAVPDAPAYVRQAASVVLYV